MLREVVETLSLSTQKKNGEKNVKKTLQFSIAGQVIKESGVLGLYRGLSAGLLRQATYTTARLGIFNSLSDTLKKRMPNGEPLPLYQKAGAGLAAGGLGALVGSPADLSLIRMQADSTLPADQRRNYKGVGDALSRIIREEGVGGLFRGAGPTVVRAMALNMGMLASNDQAKEMLAAAGYGGQTAVLGGKYERREEWFFVFLFFFPLFRLFLDLFLPSLKTLSLYISKLFFSFSPISQMRNHPSPPLLLLRRHDRRLLRRGLFLALRLRQDPNPGDEGRPRREDALLGPARLRPQDCREERTPGLLYRIPDVLRAYRAARGDHAAVRGQPAQVGEEDRAVEGEREGLFFLALGGGGERESRANLFFFPRFLALSFSLPFS